jgi:hypothetical protein
MHRYDRADMSIDERLDEVASLLAVGFLRLKRRTGCLPRNVSSLKPLPHQDFARERARAVNK